MLTQALRRFALPLFALIGGCSEQYTFTYDVTIADEVEFAEGATLRMSEGTSADDPAGIEGIEDIEASLASDERSVRDEGFACCMFSNEVNLFAYIDLDDSGSWDEGEPWGADPNNPVTIDDDGYVSAITVAPDET
ncbi:MAG: hypothetical protein AAF721_34880 [Myxococcota bacterium]